MKTHRETAEWLKRRVAALKAESGMSWHQIAERMSSNDVRITPGSLMSKHSTIVLDESFFRYLVDFERCNQRVQARLETLTIDESLVRFFINYASWNGRFANGVAALTGLIGDQHGLFVEAGLPRAVADRSNYVASFIFDAARDEFDDRINRQRDTHRCMAQATLLGMVEILGLDRKILDEEESFALQRLNAKVRSGYTGEVNAKDSALAQVFYGIGYHLGSELLADHEFSMIDVYLRETRNKLVQALMRKTISLAGADHRGFAWIGVHSGATGGGGVEADHFDAAVEGARQGFKFIAPADAPSALGALKRGFEAFADDHRDFFEIDTTKS